MTQLDYHNKGYDMNDTQPNPDYRPQDLDDGDTGVARSEENFDTQPKPTGQHGSDGMPPLRGPSQPKPTGEQDNAVLNWMRDEVLHQRLTCECGKCIKWRKEQPTGEWTYEKVAGLLGMSEERSSNYNLVVLRDAHNAAVKEAYEKGKQDGIREHYVGK